MNKNSEKIAVKASLKNGVGNTETTPCKKKQASQVSNYCFTFNNYHLTEKSEANIKHFENLEKLARIAVKKKASLLVMEDLKTFCKKVIFQAEICPTTGTPHLQGFVTLIKPMRITEFKGLTDQRVKWTSCRGNDVKNIAYCSKSESKDPELLEWFLHNITITKTQLKLINELRPWQQTIQDSCNQEPDDRTINVVIDLKGNIGKTQFTKYFLTNNKGLCATGGKVSDIASMLVSQKEKGFDLNQKFTFILDLPRNIDMNHISYTALEGVKNGLLTSTKFESSTLIFNSPHVWMFTNNTPIFNKMSEDRWNVYIVNDKMELEAINWLELDPICGIEKV